MAWPVRCQKFIHIRKQRLQMKYQKMGLVFAIQLPGSWNFTQVTDIMQLVQQKSHTHMSKLRRRYNLNPCYLCMIMESSEHAPSNMLKEKTIYIHPGCTITTYEGLTTTIIWVRQSHKSWQNVIMACCDFCMSILKIEGWSSYIANSRCRGSHHLEWKLGGCLCWGCLMIFVSMQKQKNAFNF